jgi:hypothetical protein
VRNINIWSLSLITALFIKALTCAIFAAFALALVAGMPMETISGSLGLGAAQTAAFFVRTIELLLIHIILIVYLGKQWSLIGPVMLCALCLAIPQATLNVPGGMAYITYQMAAGISLNRVLIQEGCWLALLIAVFFYAMNKMDWAARKII